MMIDRKAAKDKVLVENDAGEALPVLAVLENQEPLPEKADLWSTTKRHRWPICCALVASCGAMSEGFHTSLPAHIMVNPGFIRQLGNPGLGPRGSAALDPVHITAWTAAYTAAYICGSLLAFVPVDVFGRKQSLYASQGLLAVGCTLEVVSKDWVTWLAAKVVMGLAVSLGQCAALAYISEICPTRLRGSLLATYPLLFALGQLCATLATQIMVLTDPFRYRRVLYSQYLFVAIAVAGLGFIPESPRRLALKGKQEQARASLQRLNGRDCYGAEADYAAVMEELSSGHPEVSRRWSAVFRKSNARRVCVPAFCLVWMRWLGSNLIAEYNTYFFQLGGVLDAFTAAMVRGVIAMIGAIMALCTIERFGRRCLVLSGAPVMIGVLLIVGGLCSLPTAGATGGALVFLACLTSMVQSVSLTPVGFAYLGETSSVPLRAISISLATGGAAIASLVADYCTPLMLSRQHVGLPWAAWLYACLGSTCLLAAFFWLPETNNISYPRLDELFMTRTSARKFSRDSHDQADEPDNCA